MTDQPRELEPEFLRERATTLRDIAAVLPPSVAAKLGEVALELDQRAGELSLDEERDGE